MPADLATARRLAARCALALLGAAASAFAQGGGPAAADPNADAIAAAATPFLQAPDPRVRAEAAMIVASRPSAAREARLLALAKDEAPTARHGAWLALGLAARPAGIDALASALAGAAAGSVDAAIAAYALGLAAGPDAESAIVRACTAVERGNWKRNGPTIAALLLGMQRDDGPTATAALRALYDADDNRDDAVRALLLARLQRHDRAFDAATLLRALQRGGPAERGAALAACADAGARQLTDELLAAVAEAAKHGPTADERALALAALAEVGHLPALDLAVRAVRSGAPIEAHAGLRALRRLGGPGMLRAAAPRLVAERDAGRAEALLRAYDAPPPAELRDRCRALCAADDTPWPLRAAAAELLARAEGAAAQPTVRELFRRSRDETTLTPLARLIAADADLGRLLADDGPRDVARWAALLAADMGAARSLVLATLADARGGDAALAALRAYRAGCVLPPPPASAPPALRAALAADGR